LIVPCLYSTQPGVTGGFDGFKGYSITNHTDHNAFLQKPTSEFEQIDGGSTSSVQKASGSYILRTNNKVTAPIYFTVIINKDGSVNVLPGATKGEFNVNFNF
jgi:hypothetical protein